MSNTCPAIFQLRLPLDPIVMLTYASWSIHPSIPSPDLPTTSTSNRSQDASGIKPWLIWDHHVWIVQAWNIKKHPWWNDDNMSCIFHVYIYLYSLYIHKYMYVIYIYSAKILMFWYTHDLQWYLLQPILFPFHPTSCRIPQLSIQKSEKSTRPTLRQLLRTCISWKKASTKGGCRQLASGAEHVKSLLKTGEYSWYGCFQKYGIPQNGWFIMENPIF